MTCDGETNCQEPTRSLGAKRAAYVGVPYGRGQASVDFVVEDCFGVPARGESSGHQRQCFIRDLRRDRSAQEAFTHYTRWNSGCPFGAPEQGWMCGLPKNRHQSWIIQVWS